MRAGEGKVKKRSATSVQSRQRAVRATVADPLLKDGETLLLRNALRCWVDFWFKPADPLGMHAIRVLSGILFLAWLLPFAGQLDALYGLQGWFDQEAYREAARLPEGDRLQIGWSALFLIGSNAILLQAAYGVSLAVLALFTLGIATRLTAVLTWVIVVSFTANPAISYDADVLLVILSFYLMIGYAFLGERNRGQSLSSRLLGSRETWLLFSLRPDKLAGPRPRSVAANVAVRLLQIHLAIVIVTSGLHKLQFGDWWAGVAFWYPLYPPLVTTVEDARQHMGDRIPFLFVLSLAAYATLCWQITFPLFAWRRYWRTILFTGAVAGWLGSTFLYKLPLFGPAVLVGCLSYLSHDEWRRVCDRLARTSPFYGYERRMKCTAKLLLLAGCVTTAICCVSCAPADKPTAEKNLAPVSSGGAAMERLPVPSAEIPNGLKERIDAAIRQVEQRDIQVSNGFWTVSHGILGVGLEMTLYNPEARNRVNAIDYICNGGEVRGMRFIPTKYGLDVQNGPMFVGQGHVDQFVAEMVQTGLSPDQKFIVHGKQYTFMDFIRHTQSRVRVTTDQELSWAIIAIGQCLGTDITWTNSFNEELHFVDLVRYELNQNVEQAACGGTHRLFGLYWVYRLHVGNGGEEVGVWKEVVERISAYQSRARELQNPDGSFSTNFFRGPGNEGDMTLRINTTGHMLEWLALSLTDAQLQEPWVKRAANALSLMILDIQDSPMEGGTLYHAVHALRLYTSRLSASQDDQDDSPTVRRDAT